jgi:hypothetical protein
MLPVLTKIHGLFLRERDAEGNPTSVICHIPEFKPTEDTEYYVTAKIDGTCCYVKDGTMYARQDVLRDLSRAWEGWFPTAGLEPDKNGHIIGFRPLQVKKDKWHLDALDPGDPSRARFLEYIPETKTFQYVMRSLADVNGQTVELIGPKVNSNRHKVDKHAYMVHGAIRVDAPWASWDNLVEWMKTDGQMYEGIVIHDLTNKKFYKCHREHVGLLWDGYVLPIASA